MCNDISIYVADLSAYNSGRLHGVLINALNEVEEIQSQVNEMLKNSPEPDAEEWEIHNFEGFNGYGLSEYESFKHVHVLANFIYKNQGLAGKLLSHISGRLEGAKKQLKNIIMIVIHLWQIIPKS